MAWGGGRDDAVRFQHTLREPQAPLRKPPQAARQQPRPVLQKELQPLLHAGRRSLLLFDARRLAGGHGWQAEQ
eukprot:1161601-Pelagomonas_calceolata.AAC.10